MATLFGHLGFGNADRVFGNNSYQEQFFGETKRIFAQYNSDVQASLELFVEKTVTITAQRYRLPGGGMMQSRGGLAQSKAVKGKGYWDVAFPIYEFGDQLAADSIAVKYMTVEEYDIHVTTIMKRHAARLRMEVLKRIFNNTAETFSDPLYGSLTIRPLANTDGTLYPPVIGSEAEAEDECYRGTNYASSAIADANNPISYAVGILEGRFGAEQGTSNIITFIHPDQTAKVSALTDFVDIPDTYMVLGDNERRLQGVPPVPGTSRMIGRTNGSWVAEWRYIPTGYCVSLHLEAPKPLYKRVDEAVGIPEGLHIAAKSDGSDYPFEQSHYMDRFGFGAANRINGYVQHITASASYTIPTIYA